MHFRQSATVDMGAQDQETCLIERRRFSWLKDTVRQFLLCSLLQPSEENMAGLAADIARMKLAKKGRSEPVAKPLKEEDVDLEAEFGFGFPEDNESDFPDLSFTTRSLPNAFKAMERTPLPVSA
jgi:hypothetical protein